MEQLYLVYIAMWPRLHLAFIHFFPWEIQASTWNTLNASPVQLQATHQETYSRRLHKPGTFQQFVQPLHQYRGPVLGPPVLVQSLIFFLTVLVAEVGVTRSNQTHSSMSLCENRHTKIRSSASYGCIFLNYMQYFLSTVHYVL